MRKSRPPEETPRQELQSAPPQFEEGGQATVNDLIEVNLGTKEDPRPSFISATLNKEETAQ